MGSFSTAAKIRDWIKQAKRCRLSAIRYIPVTVTVTEALVLRPLLEDRGRITESIRILVPVDRMKQKCFQITTKRVCRSQQFQLCRQPVSCSRCSNRKGSVVNSSTCPRHDEVATRWQLTVGRKDDKMRLVLPYTRSTTAGNETHYTSACSMVFVAIIGAKYSESHALRYFAVIRRQR